MPSLSSLLQSALGHGHGHGRSRELLVTPLWSGRGQSLELHMSPHPTPTETSHSAVSAFQRPQHKLEPFTLGVIRHPDDGKPRRTPTVPHGPRHHLETRAFSFPASGPARIVRPHTTHQPGATQMHSLTPHLDQVSVSPRSHLSGVLDTRRPSYSHTNLRHARDAQAALPAPWLCNASAGPDFTTQLRAPSP